jgi:dTDP-4-dehydrorhamnose 3,5-epimerase
MRFTELEISGLWLIAIEKSVDQRGFFARTFCGEEFSAHGLAANFCQASISFNEKCATLRGMHFQAKPLEETKIVRCLRGAVYDVAVDLRPKSPTFLKSAGVELSEKNNSSLYIPAGFAHGFITLKDKTTVQYMMTTQFDAKLQRGVRWNDPAFSISWPMSPQVISSRDSEYPDFKAELLS